MTLDQPPAQAASSGFLSRVFDVLPIGFAVIDDRSRIIWMNGPCAEMVPSMLAHETLRDALVELTHEQKRDRLLLRHEVITCPGKPGGPELHWMVWTDPVAEGEWVLMVWEADWSEEMTERRTAFTMAASHELRTPLTALIGFAELLEMDDGNLRPDQTEAVRMVAETAGHLAKLVEDIFELTANSFGELRLQLERVDLGQIAHQTVEALTPEIEGSGDTLTLEVEADLPPIEADPARVRQMLGNLVRNAATHNPAGTAIEVKVRRAGSEIGVLVADDGEGLPFENVQQAFASFQRGTRRGDRTGAGIGLTITKRLIELHRGSIDVQSSPGNGAVFTLWFPVDRLAAIAPGEPGPA